MPSLEEIREWGKNDRFATGTGVEIVLAEPGHAVCALRVEERHLNANDVPMGGVIFTLADFAFAVAVNGHAEEKSVSRSSSVTFVSPARGKLLTAEAVCLKGGRRTNLYEVKVTDELGTFVAHAVMNGFVVGS